LGRRWRRNSTRCRCRGWGRHVYLVVACVRFEGVLVVDTGGNVCVVVTLILTFALIGLAERSARDERRKLRSTGRWWRRGSAGLRRR
jgi:hypothetical protein